MFEPIAKLVVVGVGLIGGSFALALREAGAVKTVIGIGRSRRNLEQALARGVLDEAGADFTTALRGAELVLLAMPVGQTESVLEQMSAHLDPETIVTDAGSTKQDVVRCARAELGSRFPRFVPGHPIAGAETSGALAARADLFRGKTVVLTPEPQTERVALARVAACWRAAGAAVVQMNAREHDRILAAVSHFPHLLAYALIGEVADRDNADTLFRFAGSGFRDLTRIAESSSEMWRDILLANREAVLAELDAYQARLAGLRSLLDAKAGARLEQALSRAREARRARVSAHSDPQSL
jgi:prephenate dehydrogenase